MWTVARLGVEEGNLTQRKTVSGNSDVTFAGISVGTFRWNVPTATGDRAR